ncbi:MAG: transketolase family protein [Planctomycetes bacterium]|nr:transketolase family protein [Planctomycetota bacterium]
MYKKSECLFESRFPALEYVLEEVVNENKKIIALTADISSRIVPRFVVNHPDRFFNFGIAEQNMFGAAAGFASAGLIPFAMTLSVFVTMRACEQIRTDIAYTNSNVKIIATGGGLAYGKLGSTHMGIEDISLMRSIPNMTIIVPADSVETTHAIREAVRFNGPVFIRFGQKENPIVHVNGLQKEFVIGKAIKLRSGNDISFIATGVMVSKAIEACNELKKLGIYASVYSFHTIKPLDKEAVLDAADSKYGLITLEDNNVNGGLGGAVAEVLGSEKPRPVKRIGIPDLYPVIGSPEELYKEYNMDVSAIVRTSMEMTKQDIG